MRFFILLLSLFSVGVVWAHGPRQSFYFVQNQNQLPSQVLFNARMGSSEVFLEGNRLTWNHMHEQDFLDLHDVSQWAPEEKANFVIRRHAYYVNFVGGALESVATGEQEAGYKSSFFRGSDPSKWARDVSSFGSVRYADIWEGVGMRTYSSAGKFKYDFIVETGASTSPIALEFDGVDGLELRDGDLVLTTSIGEIIEQAPFAYQMNGSNMEEVACFYVLDGNRLTFEFPEGYDTSRKLIIDPTVIASTLSGSNGSSNYGHCAAFDIEGNIYTGAIAFGEGYPTTTGAFQQTYSPTGGFGTDIAVSKLNPTGTDLIYATYIGGAGGDYPHSLITNQFGELFVYGSTSSEDYPTSDFAYSDTFSGGNSDIVITRLTSDGADILGSTYLGGSAGDGRNESGVNYGDAYRGEIFLTGDEKPIVTSFSSSTDFPVSSGAYQQTNGGGQDAVAFRLNATLSNLEWSTYIGGEGQDGGYGIRTNAAGEIYVAGTAGGADFPTTAGAYNSDWIGGGDTWNTEGMDGFIAKFNTIGNSLQACTIVATTEADQCFFIDLDNDEQVFVYGQTQGDLEVSPDVYTVNDGTLFVQKYDPDLSNLLVSSVFAPSGFGGYGGAPVAFLVDRCDNIYISAYNSADGLDMTADAVYDDGSFYLATFGFDMTSLEFASYYGGNHVDGGTSRFDKNGIVYQGVCSGGGFPTNADAWATDQIPGWDIGVFKMDFEVSGVNASLTASADALDGCAPHTVDFNNFSVGNIFEWDFGDGSPVSNEFEPSHEYIDPGNYEVRLISSDSLSCNLSDTAYVTIQVSIPIDFTAAFETIYNCEESMVTTNNLTGIDFIDYVWDFGDGTIIEDENAVHIYDEPGDYTITLMAQDNGCENENEISEDVTILSSVNAEIDASQDEGCGELEVSFDNESNGVTYEWDFGDGSAVNEQETPSHTFAPGTYEIELIAYNPETCNLSDTTYMTVDVLPNQTIVPDFDIFQTDCEVLSVEANDQSTGIGLEWQWNMGDGTILNGQNVTHDYDDLGLYDVTLTISEPVCDLTEQITQSINIQAEVTAAIGNDDLDGCAPLTFNFQNQSAGNTFEWDFGDGTPVFEGQAATHVYTDPGVYEVTLTATGTGGNCEGTDVTTVEITVADPPTLDAAFVLFQTGECETLEMFADNESIGENLEYTWLVNGEQFTDEDLSYVFNGEGVYTIQLNAFEPLCESSDIEEQQIEISAEADFQMPDLVYMCYYDPFVTLDSGLPEGSQVSWSTDETTPVIQVTEPGEYLIEATINGCTDIDGINVERIIETDIDKTITTCAETNVRLEVPYENATDTQWCNGETQEYIWVDEEGEYCYTFRDEFGCLQESFIEIVHIDLDAKVYIPNAFTPNNDGINDVFGPKGEGIENFNMTVWNRWGEEVFRSTSPDEYWVGDHQKGTHFVQDGLYTYSVEYNSTCSAEKITVTGFVNVMR